MNGLRFGRTLLVASVLALSAAFLGCPVAVAAPSKQTYLGPATMRVQLTNVYGQVVGTPTYTTQVEGIIAAPRGQETNRVSMFMQSKPLVNRPGEWSFASATTYSGATLQYWEYEVADNGEFSGRLTNNHAQEAAAMNLITIPTEIAPNLTVPYTLAFAKGSTIRGVIGNDRISFHIEGNTIDQAHPFVVEGNLPRTG